VKYVARKTVFYLITLWAALTINFAIPRLMPGNPLELLQAKLQGQISPVALRALGRAFGLDTHTSLLSQYAHYMAQIAQGHLGTSITYFPNSVASVIARTLPWTLVLLGVSTVISVILGTGLGIFVGWRRGSRFDSLLPATTFFAAVPYFWLGLLAVAVFATTLHWLPLSGGAGAGVQVSFSVGFIVSAAYHSVLPAATIVASSLAGWLLGMRNMMLTTMSQEYVMIARAKGLTDRRVRYMYAARNAILPSIASFAMSLGFLVGGAILVEIVFAYPGIGYTLFQAVTNEDYPLMQGIFLIITLAVLAANMLADVSYALLDPRVREGR